VGQREVIFEGGKDRQLIVSFVKALCGVILGENGEWAETLNKPERGRENLIFFVEQRQKNIVASSGGKKCEEARYKWESGTYPGWYKDKVKIGSRETMVFADRNRDGRNPYVTRELRILSGNSAQEWGGNQSMAASNFEIRSEETKK